MPLDQAKHRRWISHQAEESLSKQLTLQGWEILARNFRQSGFELDLVASKGQTLAVIEVKARKVIPKFGRIAEELLPPRKKAALLRGTKKFVELKRLAPSIIRIDLAIVSPGEIKYYPGIIDPY